MIIKTITCHHVYNYGATLQAYALQSYLESLGHKVGIIDYRLPTHIRYELFKPYPNGRYYKITKKLPMLNYLITPIKNRSMFKTWGRKKSFDIFDKKYLNIDTPTYHSYNDIKNNPPKADIFIAGSDQIWNPQMLNGTDLGYYLDFGDEKIRRFSYAASLGVNEISDKQEAFMKKMLDKFEAISVREESGLNILMKAGIKAQRDVDPVFLLNHSEWVHNLDLSLTKNNYILVYDFTHDDIKIKEFVQDLSHKMRLKILAINDYENTPYADVQINNAGPIEFLQYLINARYIVANSFHATAFSLIFHKDFAIFPLISQSNPSRITDLLRNIGLINHFQPKDVSVIDENIKWDIVDKKLNSDIEISKQYLKGLI